MCLGETPGKDTMAALLFQSTGRQKKCVHHRIDHIKKISTSDKRRPSFDRVAVSLLWIQESLGFWIHAVILDFLSCIPDSKARIPDSRSKDFLGFIRKTFPDPDPGKKSQKLHLMISIPLPISSSVRSCTVTLS